MKNCQLPGEASMVVTVSPTSAAPPMAATRSRPSRAKSGIKKMGVTLSDAARAMKVPLSPSRRRRPAQSEAVTSRSHTVATCWNFRLR